MKFFEKISEILFPENFKCIFCGAELSQKTPTNTCDECFKSLPFIKDNFCLKCGNPLNSLANYCLVCKNQHRNFDFARASFVYAPPISDTIIKAKSESAKYLFKSLAAYMADTYYNFDFNADFMVFVPNYCKNPKKKRYNQAKTLAFELSNIVNVPLKEDILLKQKDTKKQVQLDFRDRIENIKDSIIVSDKKIVKDKTILIIDDVLTSGATVNECARMLKDSGAKKVIVLTLARTDINKF